MWCIIIQKQNRLLLILAFICLILFVFIAFLTFGAQGFIFDEKANQWANEVTTPFLLSVMQGVSMLGSGEATIVIICLLVGGYLITKNWQQLLFFLTVIVGGVFINYLLKILFHRERPEEMHDIELFNYSFEIPSYSFPSGHTMRVTLLFLFLMYVINRYVQRKAVKYVINLICFTLLIAVSLSRLFLEAHFASDIVAAFFIGASWFFSCLFFFKQRNDKTKKYMTNNKYLA